MYWCGRNVRSRSNPDAYSYSHAYANPHSNAHAYAYTHSDAYAYTHSKPGLPVAMLCRRRHKLRTQLQLRQP